MLELARPWWTRIGVAVAGGLIETPLVLLAPLPLKVAIDSAIGGAPLPGPMAAWLPAVDATIGLIVAAGLAVALAVLHGGWSLADWLYREWLSERMTLALRTRMYRHGLELHLTGGTEGELDAVQRIQGDAPAIVWTTLYGLLPLLTASSSLLGGYWVTHGISPALAFVVFATVLPAAALIHAMQGRLRAGWHRSREIESAGFALVQQGLAARRVVTAYGQALRECERFGTAATQSVRMRLWMAAQEGSLNLAFTLSVAVGTGALILIGGREVANGAMTAGDLVLITGYAAQIYGPMQRLGGHVAGQQRALASARRVLEFLDRAPQVRECLRPQPLARARGAITVDRVAVARADGTPILDHVSLEIEPGTCVGIRGATGAGKSTLVDLVMRQIDPARGVVRLDGRDLRAFSIDDLRRQFAYVGQEPVLFAGTVAENIAYGTPDASPAAIEAAAQAALADRFIRALPQAYATRLGERGAPLSGGERQRLALARAFLRDAPILVLDEPTSALDVATEKAITDAIRRLRRGRTTLLIAHRLSTLQIADRVIVVADRTVREDPLDARLLAS